MPKKSSMQYAIERFFRAAGHEPQEVTNEDIMAFLESDHSDAVKYVTLGIMRRTDLWKLPHEETADYFEVLRDAVKAERPPKPPASARFRSPFCQDCSTPLLGGKGSVARLCPKCRKERQSKRNSYL